MRIPLIGTVFRILKLPIVGIILLIGIGFSIKRSFDSEKHVQEEDAEELKEEIRRLKAELKKKEP